MQTIPQISLVCGPVFRIQALSGGKLSITVEDVEPFAQAPEPDPIYNKKGVASRLKMSVRTVDNLMVHPKDPLPYSVVGGSPRFRESDLQAWLDSGKSLGAQRAFSRTVVSVVS